MFIFFPSILIYQLCVSFTDGFVIYDATAESDDSETPLVKALKDIEKRKAAAADLLNDRASANASNRKIKNKDDDDVDNDDDGDDDDGTGVSSGWFPEAFTRDPNPLELASMQAMMLGATSARDHETADDKKDSIDSNADDDKARMQQVLDILAPPGHWNSKDNPDPLNARLIALNPNDQEFVDVQSFFKQSLGDSLRKFKKITSIKRIESLSLWQSFVAKRRQLEMRALAEGKDESYAKAYENVWM